MTENNEVVEPWNDEENQSIDQRRGQFLKVLCVLSWIWIGIQLFSSVVAYVGGPERLMEKKSKAEDDLGSMEISGVIKTKYFYHLIFLIYLATSS